MVSSPFVFKYVATFIIIDIHIDFVRYEYDIRSMDTATMYPLVIFKILMGEINRTNKHLQYFLTSISSDIEEYENNKIKNVKLGDFHDKSPIPIKINQYIVRLIVQIMSHDQYCWHADLSSKRDGTDIIFYLVHFANGFDIFLKDIIEIERFYYEYSKTYNFEGIYLSLIDLALCQKHKKGLRYLLKKRNIPTAFTSSSQCKLYEIAQELKLKNVAEKCMKDALYSYLQDTEFENLNYKKIQDSWVEHGYQYMIGKCYQVKLDPLDPFDETKVRLSPIYHLLNKIKQNQFQTNPMSLCKLYRVFSYFFYIAYGKNNNNINHNSLLRKVCDHIITFKLHKGLIMQLMLYNYDTSSILTDIQDFYANNDPHLYKIFVNKFNVDLNNNGFVSVAVSQDAYFNADLFRIGDIVLYKGQCAEVHCYFYDRRLLISWPANIEPGSRKKKIVQDHQTQVNLYKFLINLIFVSF